MLKLNSLQYNMQNFHIFDSLSLHTLSNNEHFESIKKEFLNRYSFTKMNTFSFCKDGFLGLFLELNKKGRIALSVGESEALYEAGKTFESLGFEIIWIALKKDGKIDLKTLENKKIGFLFVSSYIMDTFVKTNLREIKNVTDAKIISNASADFSKESDAIYFDSYKLTGFYTAGVILFNDDMFDEKSFGFTNSIAINSILESLKKQHFEIGIKSIFKQRLIETFKEDLYFFVDPNDTLEYSLHFALKDIKARELIRTLGLNEIHITNGEGCSLGLSKPSRIIQLMGYEEIISRNAISLTFLTKIKEHEIKKVVDIFAKKYRQIKVLNAQ